ncbi:hypothetical protein QEW_0916 [Clostridioides difficile CD160]|nr:hypothetical protein QEW_0916 [Clostridioides difficile CD160]
MIIKVFINKTKAFRLLMSIKNIYKLNKDSYEVKIEKIQTH